MSLKKKIILSIIGLTVILITIINVYTNNILNDVINNNEKVINANITGKVNDLISLKLDDAEVSLNVVAKNKEVEEAFANRDRDRLQFMLGDAYASMKESIAQFNVS